MSIDTAPRMTKEAKTQLGIVDCDIHPMSKTGGEITRFMPQRWREHAAVFGSNIRQGYAGSQPYPRMSPGTARADAWPPGGGPPASDLPFMQAQHLNPNNVDYGILHPLRLGPYDQRNQEFGAAMASAINDWQLEDWIGRDKRLRGSIVVTPDWPEAAVAEIERRAGQAGFVQISWGPQAMEPGGRRRYWPVLEAVAASGLPVGLHIGGQPGRAPTSGGWPSYYFEHHFHTMPAMQSLVTSMIFEGVLERLPALRFVLVESGFGWVPSLAWRMDQHWHRMRAEVPEVKRPPSEYLREHFWFTTQPIEEPEQPQHLRDIIDWIGWDRLLFSSDYPHWDFDDPAYAFKISLSPEEKHRIFRGNASAFYGLD
ncbi:MAG TPA: amidohydrolase family protein [Stellaceae bacterium]|nr:amidohydrolase family protein [Stellaceae bacterium]